MAEPRALQLSVTLQLDADPVCGTVSDGTGPPRAFAGWLELMAAFDGARPRAEPAVALYMFPGSNAVQTAVLMLAHKGIEPEVVQVEHGTHTVRMPELGFAQTSVPGLGIGERRIQGTRAIARALDDLRPEPALFPADPVRRVLVEDAERRGEELQNAARRLFYWAILRSAPTPGRRYAAEHHRATDAAVRRDLGELPGRLDEIDAWLADGVLDGDALNAADFQIAPNVAWLPCFEDLAPLLSGRPSVAYARRVAGVNEGHVPAAFPRDWLEACELRIGRGS